MDCVAQDSASKTWVGLSSPQKSEGMQCLWWDANHQRSRPESENHSSVYTGTAVRRSKKPKAFWVVFFNTLHTSSESVFGAHCDQKGNTVYRGQNDQRDHLFVCVYTSEAALPHKRISTQQNWLEYICYSLATFSGICTWLVLKDWRQKHVWDWEASFVRWPEKPKGKLTLEA